MIKIRITQLIVLIKYYLTVLFVIITRKKEKSTWLISERGDEARDNGFAFFEFVKREHPEQNTKYVITSNSNDIKKLINYKDDVIIYRSWKHMYYFILSKYLISSHIMGFSPDFRSMGKLDRKKLLYYKGNKIFLDHGIQKDFSPGLEYENTRLDLFTVGGYKPYQYILKTYNYPDKVVQYTGTARYDSLKNKCENYILLFPTWRENLYKLNDSDFIKTNYYIKYMSLINNKDLDNILEDNNLKMIFYPHYEIQKRINLFKTNCKNIIIANSKEYDVPDLLKGNRLMITDFSSVYFDQAFLKKPVIYYHFDYDEYRKYHYQQGWFSYKDDGFGPIVKSEKELIDDLIKYIKSNFEVEEKYIASTDSIFKHHDGKNCERIYQAILEIEPSKSEDK